MRGSSAERNNWTQRGYFDSESVNLRSAHLVARLRNPSRTGGDDDRRKQQGSSEYR